MIETLIFDSKEGGKKERFIRAFGGKNMVTVELEQPREIQREFNNPSVVRVKSFNPEDLLNSMPWVERLCIIQRNMVNGRPADEIVEIWHFYPDENIVEKDLLLERKVACENIFTSPVIKRHLRSIRNEKEAETGMQTFVAPATTARLQEPPVSH